MIRIAIKLRFLSAKTFFFLFTFRVVIKKKKVAALYIYIYIYITHYIAIFFLHSFVVFLTQLKYSFQNSNSQCVLLTEVPFYSL